MSNILRWAKIISELSKVKITIAVSFTTITGYVLASKSFDAGLMLPTIGIFLLACSSSVLNHFQERKTDSMMERTKERPIPSKKVSAQTALYIAILFFAVGSYLLYTGANFTALILGWLALVWYNFIYTPLKKITANAVIPGSVIGSIPPLVGWVSGGGSLENPDAWFMAIFFFIWQVPHFYLLAIKYSKQYESAGFPSITKHYSSNNLKKVIFAWVVATVISSIVLSFTEIISSRITTYGIIISGILLIVIFFRIFDNKNTFSPGKYFMRINYFVLSVIVFLFIDHFF